MFEATLTDGIQLVYLGIEAVSLPGAWGGRTYHLGGSQRRFLAHRDDVASLLESGDIVQLTVADGAT